MSQTFVRGDAEKCLPFLFGKEIKLKVKKVVVNTVNTRKFVENLVYLGSIGGVFDDSCKAFKGMFLRAEVTVPETTIVEETPEMRVAAGAPKEPAQAVKRVETTVAKEEPTKETPKAPAKPAAKTATKAAQKKAEEVVKEDDLT